MRAYKIALIILIPLLIFRLALPYILIQYAEHQINKIPEYYVKINDLDVHLYRGSYTIKNLVLKKINKKIPLPFFESEKIDLSLQWGALLHGSFVGKITVEHPIINFIVDPKGKNDQLSIDKQWLSIVKSLFPLNFNEVTAHHGEIYYQSFSGKPPFKIYLKDVELKIDNMQNANRSQILLPSNFSFNANTMEKGSLSFQGKFNPYSKEPTFSLNTSLKSLPVNQLKGFLKHYTNVDVKSGLFSLYGEIVAANSEIKGYVKPFIKDLKIASAKDNSPIESLYNGAATLLASILKNPQKNTLATQINIKGHINNPDTSILSILGYMIKHAFIQALIPQIDHKIKMRDVLIN